MKKLFILLLPIILLTGCINGNRDFETICRKSESSDGFNEDISYKIFSNSDNSITKLVETYELSYEIGSSLGKSAFDASKSALNSYGHSNKYVVDVVEDKENKYKISFTLNVSELTDEQLGNIDRDFEKQKKIYEQDMTCSKK